MIKIRTDGEGGRLLSYECVQFELEIRKISRIVLFSKPCVDDVLVAIAVVLFQLHYTVNNASETIGFILVVSAEHREL